MGKNKNDVVQIEVKWSPETPISRKEHICSWCGQKIIKGEKYVNYNGPVQMYSSQWHVIEKFHTECYEAFKNDFKAHVNGFQRGKNLRGLRDYSLKIFSCQIWYGGEMCYKKLTNKTVMYLKEEPKRKTISVIAHDAVEAEHICNEKYNAADIASIKIVGNADGSEAQQYGIEKRKIERLEKLLG